MDAGGPGFEVRRPGGAVIVRGAFGADRRPQVTLDGRRLTTGRVDGAPPADGWPFEA